MKSSKAGKTAKEERRSEVKEENQDLRRGGKPRSKSVSHVNATTDIKTPWRPPGPCSTLVDASIARVKNIQKITKAKHTKQRADHTRHSKLEDTPPRKDRSIEAISASYDEDCCSLVKDEDEKPADATGPPTEEDNAEEATEASNDPSLVKDEDEEPAGACGPVANTGPPTEQDHVDEATEANTSNTRAGQPAIPWLANEKCSWKRRKVKGYPNIVSTNHRYHNRSTPFAQDVSARVERLYIQSISDSSELSYDEASGVTFADICKTTYEEIKKDKKHRYIIFCIKDEKQIDVEVIGPRDASYDQFLEDLQKGGADECRYGLFDFEYTHQYQGTSKAFKKQKLFLMSWCPDTAKVKKKMLYSSSFDALKKLLVGVQKYIQATDLSEASEEAVEEKLRATDRS